jgi:hypothetical protein
MFIRLIVDFGELVSVALKRVGQEKGWMFWEDIGELLVFVALVCVWVYFCCFSGGCLC